MLPVEFLYNRINQVVIVSKCVGDLTNRHIAFSETPNCPNGLLAEYGVVVLFALWVALFME